MTTLPRFLTLPTGSFFLFGPRGTGKTTWLRSVLADALVVDLLKPEEYRRMSARVRRGILCLPVDPFLRGLDPAHGLEDAIG